MVPQTVHCQVAIVGGGLAGLAAADALIKSGINAKIFEAQSFAGGRVYTKRTEAGHHYEVGAFSFTDVERSICDYVKEFDLPVVEQKTPQKRYLFQGMVGLFSENGVEKEHPCTQILNFYLGKIKLEDEQDPSFRVSLENAGASPKVIRWIRDNTLIGLLGDSFDDLSTRAALSFMRQYDGTTKSYAIQGGNDLLPKALAEKLKDHIFYNSPVTRIEQGGSFVRLKGAQIIFADTVIVTVPLTSLQKIEFNPPLPPEKMEAIYRVPYTSSYRITYESTHGIFHPERCGVFATSDNPKGWYRDQTAAQVNPIQGAIFNFICVGAEARSRLTEDPAKRDKEILGSLRVFDPKLAEQKITGTPDPWENAYVYFPPGTFKMLAILAKPFHKIFFGGEHTTPHFASMNGAIDSGKRAAEEVKAFLGGK